MSESINNDISNENEDVFPEDCEHRELVDASTSAKPISGEPVDNYKIVYFLFYLYGVTSLMPWNFFVTANDYWMYKFRDVSPHNYTIQLGKTQFQAEFTSYLNVAASIPSTFCLIFNSLYSHLIPLSIRMGGSLLVITLLFIVTTVMVQVDTDDWQDGFFILTMLTVVVINATLPIWSICSPYGGAGAIFGGSLFGIAGKFSTQYMAAVVNGQALGGIIAAVAQILSLTFKVSPLHSAMIYFIIGDLMMMASLFSYFFLSKVEFFTFYIYGACRDLGISTNNRVMFISNTQILKKIWIYCFAVGCIFIVTTAVYPSVTVLIESHHSGAGGDWNNIYFVPVVNYLIFNCGDYAGRVVAGMILKPEKKSWIIGVVAALRIFAVPLLMMCNAHPRSHLPVIIQSDWEYIILMTVFAISNGYVANISMINAARFVEHHEKERASSMMAAMLGIGISIGASLGMVLVKSL